VGGASFFKGRNDDFSVRGKPHNKGVQLSRFAGKAEIGGCKGNRFRISKGAFGGQGGAFTEP
jgi:hypothetical protein